jgi:hypothetical protein
MTPDLLTLPWQQQIVLAAGCASYMTAYMGARGHHRAIEMMFITLTFSLISTFALAITPSWPPVASGLAAVAAPLIIALAWRKWGSHWFVEFMRHGDFTWSNDDPSALATLTANAKHPVTQIAVLLDDGTWLRCDDTAKFNDAPYAPCLLGPSGDVALYLTHEEPPGGDAKELKTVRNADYGDRLTYVPASRIRCITIRHQKR